MWGAETLILNPNLQVGTVTNGTFTNTLTADGSTISGTFTGTFGPNPNIPGGKRFILHIVIDPAQGTGILAGVGGKVRMIVLTDGKGGFTYTSVGFLTFP